MRTPITKRLHLHTPRILGLAFAQNGAVEVGVIYQLYGPKLSVFRLLFAFTKSRDFKTEPERMLGDIDKCQQLTTLFAYEVSTEITEKRTC